MKLEAGTLGSSRRYFLKAGLNCRRAEINAWPQGCFVSLVLAGFSKSTWCMRSGRFCSCLLWFPSGPLGCGWCFLEGWDLERWLSLQHLAESPVKAWGEILLCDLEEGQRRCLLESPTSSQALLPQGTRSFLSWHLMWKGSACPLPGLDV